MYTNKGDKLKDMPKPVTLRDLVDAAAKGAAVLPDMAQRHDGIIERLLPENCRYMDAADLYNLQRNANEKISKLSKRLSEYVEYL